jgi:hypothetical protein
MYTGDGESPTSNANAQFEKYKSLTASVLSSRPSPPPPGAVLSRGRRPSEMLLNSRQEREAQANYLLCLPLGMGVILGAGIYKQYELPSAEWPPAEQELYRASAPDLWVIFLVCWLAMLGGWVYVWLRMHEFIRTNDVVRFERALIAYLLCCGLLVNVAEMGCQYLGLGDSSLTFLVFFTFSFGNLGLRRSLLVSAATLAIYILSALPWVGHLTGHKYDASRRVTSTLPIVLYVLFITGAFAPLGCLRRVPCTAKT